MSETIKFGVFGLGRGSSFFQSIKTHGGEIVAICDKNTEKLEKTREKLGEGVTAYTDFDEFLGHEGLEAIFVCNYFHEHAPYAIKALEKNIHVLSECTSNGTMAEGVALVRAAEKSSAFYMLAENYPFMKFNQEMRRVYRGGTLGKALFCEGEYNHPHDHSDAKYSKSLCPFSKHWRYNLPRTYYITHSLAPLIYITGALPRRVTAMPVFAPYPPEYYNGISRGVPERAAIVTCLNDDDSVYRVTGCSAFGTQENSYRICAENGQMENLRDGTGRVNLSYSPWLLPEGGVRQSCYLPEWNDKDAKLIEKSGHGGGDFFIMREFFNCIREGRKPEFDEYFATTMASVGILAHRSMLEKGTPYDIPDFHLEEDRVKYENDRLTPFYGSDGSEPNIPSTEHPEYNLTPEKMAKYDRLIAEVQ